MENHWRLEATRACIWEKKRFILRLVITKIRENWWLQVKSGPYFFLKKHFSKNSTFLGTATWKTATGSYQCGNNGLILRCTASKTSSPWHNFMSDKTHWRDDQNRKPCFRKHRKFPRRAYRFRGHFAFIKGLVPASKIWIPGQYKVTLIGRPSGNWYGKWNKLISANWAFLFWFCFSLRIRKNWVKITQPERNFR